MVHAGSLTNGSENSTEPFILNWSVLVCTLSSRLNYITYGSNSRPQIWTCDILTAIKKDRSALALRGVCKFSMTVEMASM